jgi:hypothetical protein
VRRPERGGGFVHGSNGFGSSALPLDGHGITMLLVQVEKKIKVEKSMEKFMAQTNTPFQSQSRQNDARPPRIPRDNSNIVCHYCRRTGHIQADCYKRQRDLRDRGGNNDRSRNGGNNNNYDHRRNSYNNNSRGGRQVSWRRG